MDEESKELLRRLAQLQAEQNELLRTYLPPLWTRIRFSLLGLMILMTIVAVGLGAVVFATRWQNAESSTGAAASPDDLVGPAAADPDDLFGPATAVE